MKITSVTVEIHEKRNHPNEYGHYDSRVAYTATIDETEDSEAAIQALRESARQHVIGECDRWTAQVRRDKQREDARTSLEWIIEQSDDNPFSERHEADFKKHLSVLPEDERADFCNRLDIAREQFLEKTRNYLDRLIRDAQSNSATFRSVSIFDNNLKYLPESERATYTQRLEEALTPKVEAPPLPAEPAMLDEPGDVPF